MKRWIKVTVRDFDKLAQHLNDPNDLVLYQQANGHTYEAQIEPDGYAVIDLPDDEYIELAPDEYELMIAEWQQAGQWDGLTLETKSDPDDDAALLYRLVDSEGREVRPPQPLPKRLVQLLAKTWFGK